MENSSHNQNSSNDSWGNIPFIYYAWNYLIIDILFYNYGVWGASFGDGCL